MKKRKEGRKTWLENCCSPGPMWRTSRNRFAITFRAAVRQLVGRTVSPPPKRDSTASLQGLAAGGDRSSRSASWWDAACWLLGLAWVGGYLSLSSTAWRIIVRCFG